MQMRQRRIKVLEGRISSYLVRLQGRGEVSVLYSRIVIICVFFHVLVAKLTCSILILKIVGVEI